MDVSPPASPNTIAFSNLKVHVQDNNVTITPNTGSPFTLSEDELNLIAGGTIPAGLSRKLNQAELKQIIEFAKSQPAKAGATRKKDPVLKCLKILAGTDEEHAKLRNGEGFKEKDIKIGNALAGLEKLGRKQFARAQKLLRKYEAQLPPELYLDTMDAEWTTFYHAEAKPRVRETKTATQPTGTGILDPDAWFTYPYAEQPEFVPYLCAMDYLRAFPHVVAEYQGIIHQFAGKFWLRDSEGTVRSNIEHAGHGIIKPKQISEAVESLRNLIRITDPERLGLPMEQILPLPDHTIPLDDGLFNLLTRALVPHSPDHYYTECLPRKYIPGATPEVFLSFLGFLFKGDPDAERKITQIFEAIAWILMPNYSIQGTVILYGQGGEGKSILHDIIAETIVHTTSLTLSELETDKFKRAELQGSWANLVSESTSEIITSEWFKRLTDGTTFTADRKNQHPFQFASRAKMILDVNELPNKERELRAFYRRVITIIDFPNLLELVLTPAQIDEFVTKLKDPAELDLIFSYVVDRFYAPLVSRMKFTSQLSISDAEQKWQERSNPAMSYLKAKDASGEILTDVEDVKVILASEPEKVQRYITRDKDDGEEHLTMVKADVIAAAVKWANQRGFPGRTINAKTVGSALESLGYSNLSVSKRITKGTVLRAWKDIFIDLSSDVSQDVTDVTVGSDPPKIAVTHFSSEKHGPTEICNGSDPHSLTNLQKDKNNTIDEKNENNMRDDNRKTSVTDSCFALGNAVENPVTGENRHPLPNRNTTPGAYNSESSPDIAQSSVQSEKEDKQPPITLEAGKLIIDKLLAMGYHVDPGSGPSIDQKYYKIGILGHRSIPADMREKLEYIMQQEHFTLFNTGVFGVLWYTRPLTNAQGEDPQ